MEQAGTAQPVERHWLQRLLDNPWVLLLLGLGFPTLSYTVWGIIELLMVPDGK